ncbi:MAG TPA: adenylate/guanylate cyclase domain-containing protein [Acidimicrobiia bacterium]|nr:adenylate/guanylate cyclase domain-containing protein [Acidimicrobiia bacterium]
MVAGFLVHAVAYATVCGGLVVVWALGEKGSFDQLGEFVRNPDTIKGARFWPIWPILAWGGAVLIHAAAVLSFGIFPGRRRRRQRREHREQMLEHAKTAAEIGRDAVGTILGGARRTWSSVGGPGRPTGPERRWVTVMFTDLVNSTQLNEALGDEEWSRLLRVHRESVRAAFLARGGEEVSTAGDGFLVRFPSPAEAVLSAIDIQRDVTEARRSNTVVPSVRIGIHAGEAVEDEGDLVGRVVNLASRVASEAAPDEILVTEPVADYLGGRISLEDRGVRELKGFTAPRHLLSVVWQQASEPAG